MAILREFARIGFCTVRTIGGLALIAGLLTVSGGAARCQDQSAATAADAINARKTMMDAIDDHMTAIEGMVYSGHAIDLDAAHEHADTISVMLAAFPHLFPPSTNQWKPNVERDPVRDTYASPDLWKNFADFYEQATAASKFADVARRADKDADFIKAVASLRGECNSCHSAYLKIDQ